MTKFDPPHTIAIFQHVKPEASKDVQALDSHGSFQVTRTLDIESDRFESDILYFNLFL